MQKNNAKIQRTGQMHLVALGRSSTNNKNIISRRAASKQLLCSSFIAASSPAFFVSQAKSAMLSPLSEEFRQQLKQTIQEADSFRDRFEAEVWLVDMSGRLKKYVKDQQERLHILKTVHYEASRNDLNVELVLAVIHVESLFDRFAISSVGAQGLMQIMPFWKKELNSPDDNLIDIDTNIRYGCAILKTYLKIEKGSYRHALARYNGSAGKNWYPERVFNAWESHWYVKKRA